MPDTNLPALPVETFKEAAPLLRRPFTPEAVKFKVQAGTLAVAYIDARLVVERLNMVCPHLWSDAYEASNKGMVCHLTVDGITRTDYGSDYIGKGLFSDAFKRTAVKFGVGVSLYSIPATWLKDGQIKDAGKSKVITDEGMRFLRGRYAAWLKSVGVKTFGEPLDHGDTEESVGDVEAMVTPADAIAAGEPTDDQRSELVELLKLHKITGADKELLLGSYEVQAGVSTTFANVEKLLNHLRSKKVEG